MLTDDELRQMVRPGWLPLVRPLVEACERENVPIFQIKEKFGGLRFYLDGVASEALHAMIKAATEVSYRTCEECGRPGKHQSFRGWLATLCEDCATSRRQDG